VQRWGGLRGGTWLAAALSDSTRKSKAVGGGAGAVQQQLHAAMYLQLLQLPLAAATAAHTPAKT
jgi:hypothetical protein